MNTDFRSSFLLTFHIGYRIAFLQYRRKFWSIAIIFAICGEFSSANICESPTFLPCTVIYLLFQFSWLLVPCLTINFGDFLCDLFVELPNFSQILLTSSVIIFVFCQYSCPIWLSFLNINFCLTVGLTFHLYFPHTHELSNINSELKQFWTLPFAYFFVQFNALFSAFFVCISCFSCSAWKKFHQITYLSDSFLSKYFLI